MDKKAWPGQSNKLFYASMTNESEANLDALFGDELEDAVSEVGDPSTWAPSYSGMDAGAVTYAVPGKGFRW
jgi:hypothetical protein